MTAPADRVAEIRQRLEAATPGPWEATCMGSEGYHVHEAAASDGIRRKRTALCTYEKWETDVANAALIAAAPADIAWLLSRLAVVEAERDELRAKVAELDAQVAGLSRLDGGPQDDPTAHTLKHFDVGECLCECRRCWRDDHCVCRDCSGEGHDHSRRALSGTTEGPS